MWIRSKKKKQIPRVFFVIKSTWILWNPCGFRKIRVDSGKIHANVCKIHMDFMKMSVDFQESMWIV